MILLIDNFDSFTYNLYQLLLELGEEVLVKRNNSLTIQEIKDLSPACIILSPGPGRPEESGICMEIIKNLSSEIPILGVCLGHQAIGQVFGATVCRARQIKHGKASGVVYIENELFKKIPQGFQAMRYHSLIIKRETIPLEMEAIATSEDDEEIMAIRHKEFPLYGVQFHPESIGTPYGKMIITNFLELTAKEALVHE